MTEKKSFILYYTAIPARWIYHESLDSFLILDILASHLNKRATILVGIEYHKYHEMCDSLQDCTCMLFFKKMLAGCYDDMIHVPCAIDFFFLTQNFS